MIGKTNAVVGGGETTIFEWGEPELNATGISAYLADTTPIDNVYIRLSISAPESVVYVPLNYLDRSSSGMDLSFDGNTIRFTSTVSAGEYEITIFSLYSTVAFVFNAVSIVQR